MSNILDIFINKLSESEKNQVAVLDAYFKFRSNVPYFGGKELVTDYKTTADIIDDLSEMMVISNNIVIRYMQAHSFNIVTLNDGSVRWQIWRIADGCF
jgi:hypothetical protein